MFVKNTLCRAKYTIINYFQTSWYSDLKSPLKGRLLHGWAAQVVNIIDGAHNVVQTLWRAFKYAMLLNAYYEENVINATVLVNLTTVSGRQLSFALFN